MRNPGFLQTFVGSFYNLRGYDRYSDRSTLSMAGHYLLLITLCCILYAGMTGSWLSQNLAPHVDDLVANVPSITIKDGKASVDIEQPHFFQIEGEKVAVIDTTQDPQVYLDEYEQIVVLSETRLTTKDQNGTIESYELNQDIELNSGVVEGWLAKAKAWVLPALFLVCFLWQVGWKAVQALLVAAVVTLVQKSRPDFATHWRLANLALGPAMAFGLVVYGLALQGVPILGSSILFWLILGGLTYHGSQKLRRSPFHS